MDEPSLTLRPADADALAYVERLLDANGLPSTAVRSGPGRFYVALDGDRVGVGGLEPHGAVALLRSVVVEAPVRGQGYGAALCRALEARARDDGSEALYLLTTTAAGFFADRGYVETTRAGALAAIRGTTQFTDSCPASATCMRKSL